MKKTIFILLFFISFPILQAQNLTLQDAIQQGLEHSFTLKTQTLQVQISSAENAKIRAGNQPQVSASSDVRYNAILQKSVIPIGAFGLPNTPSDAVQTVAFGVPFNATISLDATKKLYDAQQGINRKINDNKVESQKNNLEQSKNDLRFAISSAYYNVLYQQEKVKLAQQTLDRAKVNLDNGNIRLTNGKALINDINRLALDVSNAELSLRKTQQDNALAWSELKYRMQVPEETNLVLAETLPLLLKSNTNLDATINNTTIKSEQIALTDNQLQIEKSLKQNAFSVSAYGNFSLLALNENISPFSYVGVKVSKPLYDGKLAKLTAEDFTIKQQINQINLEKIQSDLNFELKTARKKVEQAQLDLLESEKNTTLARQIYQTDQLRFEQGALLQNDLKSSELSLQTAENNYLIAIYNILLTSLEVKKVTGNW